MESQLPKWTGGRNPHSSVKAVVANTVCSSGKNKLHQRVLSIGARTGADLNLASVGWPKGLGPPNRGDIPLYMAPSSTVARTAPSQGAKDRSARSGVTKKI